MSTAARCQHGAPWWREDCPSCLRGVVVTDELAERRERKRREKEWEQWGSKGLLPLISWKIPGKNEKLVAVAPDGSVSVCEHRRLAYETTVTGTIGTPWYQTKFVSRLICFDCRMPLEQAK